MAWPPAAPHADVASGVLAISLSRSAPDWVLWFRPQRVQTVRWGGKPVQTLDEASRILLTRAAADKAGLREVGLSFHDVYGLIEAETSWIPRTGASKDGTANLGLAQFEPRTAKGLGLQDPNDPVQAVYAAALHMKGAAPADVQATLTEFTASVCAADVQRYGKGSRLLIVCGGGALNDYLLARLRALLPGVDAGPNDVEEGAAAGASESAATIARRAIVGNQPSRLRRRNQACSGRSSRG